MKRFLQYHTIEGIEGVALFDEHHDVDKFYAFNKCTSFKVFIKDIMKLTDWNIELVIDCPPMTTIIN